MDGLELANHLRKIKDKKVIIALVTAEPMINNSELFD